MNWDNQNNQNDQDPWGRKNQDDISFDDLIKKFSVMFSKQTSGSNGSSGNNGMSFPTKKTFLYGFFGLLVIYASMCVYQLDSPERAVVLRFGEYYEETGEGLNFMLAGVDEKYVENVALTRRYSQTANMLTKDENLVDVTVSVQYRIKNLKDFVLSVKDPESSLREATESSLRHVVGDNTLEETLTTGRETIAQDVDARLQSYLDLYQTGLVVQQVNIEKTDPPSAVKASFDDVVAAREDKVKLQNEAERYGLSIVPEARGQAFARIQAAEAYREEVVANAEGEVARFDKLLFEYQKAPKVTRDRLVPRCNANAVQ